MSAYENQDYIDAFRTFSALAESGDADAQYLLGRLYARGQGVLQDHVQAHRWFNLASAGGHRQAWQALEKITALMTAEQLARAQELASTWQLTAPDADPPDHATLTEAAAAPLTEVDLGRIQLLLNKLGFEVGMVDGQLTDATRRAIADYQMARRLPVDGQATPALLAHLLGSQPTAQIAPGQATAPTEEPTWQWRRVLLRDGFEDGNYSADPAWNVIGGRFWVESRTGLRSAALLDQADQRYAEIHTVQPIGNAFAIRLTLSARQSQGRLEFGPYQGDNRSSGYRLFYEPGTESRFGIRRLGRDGGNVFMSKRRFRIDDGNSHTLLWTRDSNGRMTVTLDGNELLELDDRGVQGDFDGFTFINRGGDYGLRDISIHGAG